jgi:hypothetical protein
MRAEPLLPGAVVVRHWPSQLLMRSQGPRGSIAIDRPMNGPRLIAGNGRRLQCAVPGRS